MKHKKLLAAIATLALGSATAMGVLAGCTPEHEHTYSEKWGSDSTGHWHYATCDDLKEGDKEYKKDFAAHEWGNDDECDVCHYTRTPAVTEYTVTLNVGDGTLSSGTSTTLTTVNGKLASLPTPTAPNGKAFKGWYTAATGGTEVNTSYTFTGDAKTVTIYAQYVVSYTITLDAHGGTLVGSATVNAVDGKLATLPEAPTAERPELTFNGWYTEAEGGAKITEQTVFDKDATIHAQWRATDGIYTADGTLIEALEAIAPDDSAKKQYGGSGIELSAGDEFVIKVEGAVLTHAVGTLELWLANGCHGVNFDQSQGTFTVKRGNDRAFDIYAKYYDDNTPCWSIYINDGLTDVLHAGGAYLVGSGWEGSVWDISADNYIDPENGITVTLAADASFKITDCLDVTEGENRGWKYNNSKYYAVKDNAEGYLDFAKVGPSGNAAVLAPGEYTINIVKGATDEDIKFVFTPAEGLEPAPVEDKFVKDGFYLAGSGFEGAEWNVKEGFYVDPDNGLTVNFEKGAKFQIIRCTNSVTGAAAWEYGSASYYRMATGKEEGYIEITDSGNKSVKAAGQYTITLDNSGDKPVFILTPANDVQPDLTQPVLRYFIKGSNVTGWDNKTTEEYELKETGEGTGIYEMSIELAAKDEFLFYSMNDYGTSMTEGKEYIKKYNVVEGTDCVDLTLDNGNLKTIGAGTYAFSFNAATGKLTITFTHAE